MTQLRCVIFGLLCSVSAQTFAVPPMLASEFARDCASGEVQQGEVQQREFQEGKILQNGLPERCVLYISGFLDGAVATDARVAENVTGEPERNETFTERAFRTRVGERMQHRRTPAYAEYCIGEPIPLAEVVELVRREIASGSPGENELARDTVYALLRKHYPCPE